MLHQFIFTAGFLVKCCPWNIKSVKKKDKGLKRLLTSFVCTVEGLLQFTSPYNGWTGRGLAGSSVNFSWHFFVNVGDVQWGLKESGIHDFESNGMLVKMQSNKQVFLSGPPEYNGRVSGRRSSGQAVFTFSSITKVDERFYGCRLEPARGLFDFSQFNIASLVVEGG